MAERRVPTNLASSDNPPRTSSTTQPARGGATLATVRRNLFQAQRARRPAAPSSQNSAETLKLDADAESVDSSEIVVRDRNGEVELGEPPELEVGEEESVESVGDDSEKERQKLAEAVKHHQLNNSAMPDQPEEALEAVRASLRAKVAALAEDNWMYESEDQIR